MYKSLAIAALLSAANAHMHLEFPPTLKGDNNPFTKGSPDAKLNYPYGCCGQKALDACHGHLGLLDTDEGKPVVSWDAGQTANFTLSGLAIKNTQSNPYGGTHYGGSCQVGFSVDKGKTFKVAATWNGNCPLRHGSEDPSTQKFEFTVPEDMPSGNAVFAWTWINREKEFNMNCASVTIQGGSGGSPNQQEPSEPPSEKQKPKEKDQYTLSGCTCECPSQSWTDACTCYDCASPKTNRKNVARQALNLHKRRVQSNASRRGAVQAFANRGNMMIDPTRCDLPGNPFEVEFDTAGGEVVDGDGEYKLTPLSC